MANEKIQMPGPVGYLEYGRNGKYLAYSRSSDFAQDPLITTTQAEAYAVARVREALAEAQSILTGMYTEALKARVSESDDEEGFNQGCLERALALTDATMKIRSLISQYDNE